MSAARRCGEAVAAAAGELARAWRSGRSGGRRAAPAGHIDGLVESFLAGAGRALAAGEAPGAAWSATAGVLRLRAGDAEAAAAESEREWTLVRAVATSACEALEGGEEAFGWLEAAVEAARQGTRALVAGAPHGGVVIVWTWRRPARR
jgi:hypothetical protein